MAKQKVASQINLERLAGGAFAEKLNEALMQVAENIQNPNTEATTKRQINIAIKFAPNKSRQVINTQISVTTKLAATEAIDTQMVMGVNMRTGQIEIAEYDGQIRGQMNLSDFTEEEQQQEEAAGQQEAELAEAEREQDIPTGAPAFKLVSADGGRWEAVAVDNVKSYLVEALADIPNREQITIIA